MFTFLHCNFVNSWFFQRWFFIFVVRVNKVFDVTFINSGQSDVEIFEYLLKFIIGPRMVSDFFCKWYPVWLRNFLALST